ncbi:MAG: glutaredoxin 3 [Candidatus Dadabacteria bacterium]|nr:glutaredoxin 3 [Candidatus Dadabacteria bacterium]MDE0519575.1 glutaredoxin 3 [Candidatus Dadabacteria bacterium]MDE0663503.1 glutaredoxin 3 [Candidatus Dadabacteria bacterium]
MSSVTIYTSFYCTYCARAKRLLDKKQVDYEEIRLDENPEKREELIKRLNWRTVPMIFVGKQFIGGYDDLAALEHSGELDRMLASQAQGDS